MFDPHDPKLTAYVLGELEEPERAEWERRIAESPELQAAAEEIRSAARLLGDALRDDSTGGLQPAQRKAISEAAARSEAREFIAPLPPSRRGWLLPAALAATLVVAVVSLAVWNQGDPARSVARQQQSGPSQDEGSPAELPATVNSAEEETRSRPSSESQSEAGRTQSRQRGRFDGTSDAYRAPAAEDPEQGDHPFTDPPMSAAPADVRYRRVPGDQAMGVPGVGAMPGGGSMPGYGGMPGAGDGGMPGAGDGGMPGAGELSGMGGTPGMGGMPGAGGPGMDNSLAGVKNDDLSAGGIGLPRNAAGGGNSAAGQNSAGGYGGSLGGAGFGAPASPSDSTAPEDLSNLALGAVPAANPAPGAEKGPGRGQWGAAPRGRVSDLGGLLPERELEELNADEKQSGKTAAGTSKAAAGKPGTSWRRDRVQPNTTRLMVGDQDSLPLEGAQMNVVIDGFRARVVLDCYYLNDRPRQLEGAFQLRLPNEASLHYFAFGETSFQSRPNVDQLASRSFVPEEVLRRNGTGLDGIRAARRDSWTNVKEARLVPRQQASHAYSEVVRRRVDPALVEWSGAGVFEAKVFPLQPNKLHRIVIGYDVNLQRQGDDLVYSLPLPDISQVVVDLDVAAAPGMTAEVTPSVRPFVSGGRAFYHFEQPAGGSIDVRLTSPGNVLLRGKDDQSGEFFATRFVPELPGDESQSASSHAVFLLDTSLSSRPDKFNVWLSLLEATLRENRDTLKQFAVLVFNVETHWWREGYVPNTPDNIEQLVRYCQSLALEGATDLRQALAEASSPDWQAGEPAAKPDLFVLSDGAATWGDTEPRELLQAVRSGTAGTVFAYRTALSGTDVSVLELLAQETGGAVFSIAEEKEVESLARAHRRRPWQLLDATVTGGSDLLIAGRPRSIYPGQSLLLVGRGNPAAEGVAQGEVLLRLRQAEQTREVRTALHRVIDSPLMPRLYGQVATEQLEEFSATTEPIAQAYARYFRVTGRSCSLLMLESEADYERYGIRPHEDLFVVQSTPVQDLVARKLDERARRLDDARTRMLAWLNGLEQVPGLQFTVSPALQLAVERMPDDTFRVPPQRLECRQRGREAQPKGYFQSLSERELNYGAIVEEAERRLGMDGAADALRVLSNLVEQRPGDDVLLQDVAFTAVHWGLPAQAYPLLQRVAAARPYQPHVYLALAQCLGDLGKADLALIYYEVVLNAQWHERYQDVRAIAAVQYGHLLRRVAEGDLKTSSAAFTEARRRSLRESGQAPQSDLVVVMMWNTDRTDVDLHVREPSGEECYYKNRSTRSGGTISGDVTEGLGPEMYRIAKAAPGDYVVMANYYNTDANRTGLRTKVYVTVYRDYGRTDESVERQMVTLTGAKEKRELTIVKVKP